MNTLQSMLLASLLLGLNTSASANPRIEPGLWEHRMNMGSGDAKLAQQLEQAQRAMASMPPEQRKMMEEMMARQGVAIAPGGPGGGAGMTIKFCLTPEQAAKQELPAADKRCTQQITQRTANSLKFVVECPAEHARGEGETTFPSPKAYDGRFRMQRNKPGAAPESMDMTVQARWVGSDCGAIKPAK
jgi:hypothetical protein